MDINKTFALAMLECLAVGDSFGKSTEFASRSTILKHFKQIDRLLLPRESLAHGDMEYAQVTDDTEQNIFLITDYAAHGSITPEIAAQNILRWYQKSPEPEKYIGPSTSKALIAMQSGTPLHLTGISGTSCGGVMHAPSAYLCSKSLSDLEKNIFSTLSPTHNTMTAMEAAMAYGYALWAMKSSKDVDEITQFVLKSCLKGRFMVAQEKDLSCLPSCEKRLEHLLSVWHTFQTKDDLLDFLFYVYGTTVSSCDVFVASYALFLWAKNDVFLAIQMATMLGGDTDTIACLAAVLCCGYCGYHNIPSNIVDDVKKNNKINFPHAVQCVMTFHPTPTNQEKEFN